MELTDYINVVNIFHATFRVKRPPLGHGVLFRNKILWEEFNELKEAKDKTDALDAITDMLYIAAGTLDLYDPLLITQPIVYKNQNSLLDFMNEIEYAVSESEWLNAHVQLMHRLVNEADERGFDLDGAFMEVHNSNMSKLDDNGQPVLRADGKVLKGPNYWPPRLEKYTRKVEDVGTADS